MAQVGQAREVVVVRGEVARVAAETVAAAVEGVRVEVVKAAAAKAGAGAVVAKAEAMAVGCKKYASTLWCCRIHTPCHNNCSPRLQYTVANPVLGIHEPPRSKKLMMDQCLSVA